MGGWSGAFASNNAFLHEIVVGGCKKRASGGWGLKLVECGVISIFRDILIRPELGVDL